MEFREEGVLSVAVGNTDVPNHRRTEAGIGIYDGTASWTHDEKPNIVAGIVVIGRLCGWYIIPSITRY